MKRRSIKSLEGELKRLKRTLHNNNMNNIAKEFQKDLVERMTPAELKIKEREENGKSKVHQV